MGPTIKDMSIEDLRALIEKTVRDTIEDYLEDLQALSSENYLCSIEEARRDYKEGRVKTFEEVFDV